MRLVALDGSPIGAWRRGWADSDNMLDAIRPTPGRVFKRVGQYPTELPLREVLLLARHCSGGVILGFEQHRSLKGLRRPGTDEETRQDTPMKIPTPWNQPRRGSCSA